MKKTLFQICFPRLLLLTGILLFWIGSPLQAQRIFTETLESLVSQAIEAFGQNDFAQAGDLFLRIKADYGDEEEYQDLNFLRRLLPLKAFSLLQAERYPAAVEVFSQYLETFASDPRPNAFMLYNYGVALRRAGRVEDAGRQFARFRENYPNRIEAAFAALQQAEMLFAKGDNQAGIAILKEFSSGEGNETLRTQARLVALQRALENAAFDLAIPLLFDRPWDLETMPEIASLSFSALQVGEHLLRLNDDRGALRAFRMVVPADRLLPLQNKRIEEVKNMVRTTAASLSPVARDYYVSLVRRMEQQVEVLQEMDDYTPNLHLLRGQALLRLGRHREAWLLFEDLSLNESISTELRENAHYRWILTAIAIDLPDEALTIARNFTRRYPDSPLAPEAFTLIAQTHSEAQRYTEANEVLGDLILRFPDHPLRQRWLFTRGFHYAILENFNRARADFIDARDDFSATQITTSADFWLALTYFFERDFDRALREFNRLAQRYREHPIYPEILYRRASTLYGMRDLPQTLAELNRFLDQHPLHLRAPEALVLKGDVLMGKGQLDEAIEVFSRLTPEQDGQFVYAVFQIAKIHEARNDLEALAEHFTNYASRTDMAIKPRLSEALYKVAWAYRRLEREADALPLFAVTLSAFGNERSAGEIQSILTALGQTHTRFHQDPAAFQRDASINQEQVTELARTIATSSPEIESLRRSSLQLLRQLAAENDFERWIRAARETARNENNLVWYSRLTLHLAERMTDTRRIEQANVLYLDLHRNLSPDQLDAPALARVGEMLRNFEMPGGEVYFRQLLRDFPHSGDRASAYHGLGLLAFQKNDYETALEFFERFNQETPTHRLAPEVFSLTGQTMIRLGQLQEAIAMFEDILQRREMRGRAHAEALSGLGEAHVLLGRRDEAIAYFQRVYTLYRAFPDLLARAYLESARLFEERGDWQAAYNTYAEFLATSSLQTSPLRSTATREFERLAREYPRLQANSPES